MIDIDSILANHKALDALTERDGFRLGDVVHLCSGGATMTVIGFDTRCIRCAFMTVDGYTAVSLPPQAIIHATEDEQ